jgi:hypothetical protein
MIDSMANMVIGLTDEDITTSGMSTPRASTADPDSTDAPSPGDATDATDAPSPGDATDAVDAPATDTSDADSSDAGSDVDAADA